MGPDPSIKWQNFRGSQQHSVEHEVASTIAADTAFGILTRPF